MGVKPEVTKYASWEMEFDVFIKEKALWMSMLVEILRNG